jgi:hypothetical protein
LVTYLWIRKRKHTGNQTSYSERQAKTIAYASLINPEGYGIQCPANDSEQHTTNSFSILLNNRFQDNARKKSKKRLSCHRAIKIHGMIW